MESYSKSMQARLIKQVYQDMGRGREADKCQWQTYQNKICAWDNYMQYIYNMSNDPVNPVG